MKGRLLRAVVIAVALLGLLPGIVAAEPAISAARPADNGFVVHDVQSEYQSNTTQIFVRMPAKPAAGRTKVLYVLPVEVRDEQRWGDARAEIAKLNLADRHGVIVVFPTLSHLPWFTDHPSDPRIRQESYFLQVVVPFIERTYPAQAAYAARLLLGFSKSGWGAWALLLRHPDMFGKAAAWDAPMTMEFPKYGIGPIVGTAENFERYRITNLLPRRGKQLGNETRLMLMGYDFYREQAKGAHQLMQALKIPHAYRDGPQRRHHWNSGWMAEMAQWIAR